MARKSAKEQEGPTQAEATQIAKSKSERSLRRNSRNVAAAAQPIEARTDKKSKAQVKSSEQPQPKKRQADADADVRPSKRKKQEKPQDVPLQTDPDDSSHQQAAAGTARVCHPCSPTRTRRRVEPQLPSADANVTIGCSSVLTSPSKASLAAAQHGAFDPCKQEHVSLCLSALSMEVSVNDRPAPDQPMLPVAPGASMVLPGAPHGRQQQFEQLFTALSGACKDGTGRSVYISGLPGTGKSHTVRAVVRALQANGGQQQAPLAAFVSCFGQTDAGHVHAAVLDQVASQAGHTSVVGSAEGLPSEQAYDKLVSYLQTLGRPSSTSRSSQGASSGAGGQRGSRGGSSGAGRGPKAKGGATADAAGPRMVVVLLDEVDRLLGARNGIDNMVKLFMLPHASGVQCCVVAMANSIDITERCLPELKLRGCAPLFMPFGAYLRPQLLSILTGKLACLPWTVFDGMALELVARKVASSTGDVRKALQACRVALRMLHEQATAAAGAAATTATTGPTPTIDPASPSCQPAAAAVTSPRASHPPTANAGLAAAVPVSIPVSRVPALVTAKEMVSALSRINYTSEGSASAVNSIRNLPQQQQVHLLALASALATAAAQAATDAAAEAMAAEHGLTTNAYRAKYYWGPSSISKPQVKLANPFAQASAGGTGTPGGGAGTPGGNGAGAGRAMFAGDAARAVPLAAAYTQYRALCTGMFQQPCSEQEFCTTQQLLSHLGLVGVGGAGGVGGMQGRGGGRGRGKGRGGAGHSLSSVQLVLKASMKDIQNALKDNVVFKKALAVLPGA